MLNILSKAIITWYLKPQGQGFEICQLIDSDKSNLLRKVDFLLKSGFQVIAFFYSFGGRIPCYNCRNFLTNEQENYFRDIIKLCLIGLYFRNIFPIGSLILLWSRDYIIIQNRTPKWLLSCEDKKRRHIVPVLK